MEDLWRVQSCGIEMEDFANIAEYRQLLKRFSIDEERNNRRRLLHDGMKPGPPGKASSPGTDAPE